VSRRSLTVALVAVVVTAALTQAYCSTALSKFESVISAFRSLSEKVGKLGSILGARLRRSRFGRNVAFGEPPEDLVGTTREVYIELLVEWLDQAEVYWNGSTYISPRTGKEVSQRALAGFITAYTLLWIDTGEERFRERAELLADRLVSQQAEDGSWVEIGYRVPKKSTLTTGLALQALSIAYIELEEKPGWRRSIEMAADYIVSQLTPDGWIRKYPDQDFGVYNPNALCLAGLVLASRITGNETYAQVAASVAHKIVDDQLEDGGWTYGTVYDWTSAGYQTMVLRGLADYYKLTGDSYALDALVKGADWLFSRLGEDLRFHDEEETPLWARESAVHHAWAAAVFEYLGMRDRAEVCLKSLIEVHNYAPTPKRHAAPIEALAQIAECFTTIYYVPSPW